MCRRTSAQNFQNLRKFLPFERNSGENGPNFVFWAQSDQIFFKFYMFFMAFSVHVSAQSFIFRSQSAQKISLLEGLVIVYGRYYYYFFLQIN